MVGLKQCPAEVAMPVAVPFNLVALDEARARGEQTGTRITGKGSMLVNTVHVWAAYRQSKTIYEIELLLSECLARSPWPADTPTAALRLPSLCPILRNSHEDGVTNYVAATYDLLTGAETSGALELRLSLLTVDGDLWAPFSILHLARPTFSECVEAAAAEARVDRGGMAGRTGRADPHHPARIMPAAPWKRRVRGVSAQVLMAPDASRAAYQAGPRFWCAHARP